MMFWHSICSVSASEVTRLNTRPLVNSPLTAGEMKSTFLKVSCTSSARSWYPAYADCHVIKQAVDEPISMVGLTHWGGLSGLLQWLKYQAKALTDHTLGVRPQQRWSCREYRGEFLTTGARHSRHLHA